MKYDIISVGEALIDFTDIGTSENGMKIFEQNPGGAPANVACACAKLGLNTAFLGKVGRDMHGDFIIETLKNCGVHTENILRDDNSFTTLAFVKLDKNGDRSFSFARKHSADTMLSEAEINFEAIKDAKILHFGSLSLTDEPSRGAVVACINAARKNNTLVSYDPNYRPLLWKSKKDAEEQMRFVLPFVDMIKLSDNETELLCGTSNLEEAAGLLHEKGIRLVLITCGKKGAFVSCNGSMIFSPSYEAEVIDTTGAGDSFLGGFLYKMCAENNASCEMGIEDAQKYAAFANRVAGFCVSRRGAIPALPYLKDVTDAE